MSTFRVVYNYTLTGWLVGLAFGISLDVLSLLEAACLLCYLLIRKLGSSYSYHLFGMIYMLLNNSDLNLLASE